MTKTRQEDDAKDAEVPVQPGEFGSDEKLLELDADGWEEFADEAAPTPKTE